MSGAPQVLDRQHHREPGRSAVSGVEYDCQPIIETRPDHFTQNIKPTRPFPPSRFPHPDRWRILIIVSPTRTYHDVLFPELRSRPDRVKGIACEQETRPERHPDHATTSSHGVAPLFRTDPWTAWRLPLHECVIHVPETVAAARPEINLVLSIDIEDLDTAADRIPGGA